MKRFFSLPTLLQFDRLLLFDLAEVCIHCQLLNLICVCTFTFPWPAIKLWWALSTKIGILCGSRHESIYIVNLDIALWPISFIHGQFGPCINARMGSWAVSNLCTCRLLCQIFSSAQHIAALYNSCKANFYVTHAVPLQTITYQWTRSNQFDLLIEM